MTKRKATPPVVLFRNLFYSLICVIFLLFCLPPSAQAQTPYVRIATIRVDSAQLDSYKAALKEHAEAAVSKEPGVITLYAVYDKAQPTHVTVFEIYASVPAYQLHIKTPHFLKYKNTVNGMVTALVLTDVVPIALETKQKISNGKMWFSYWVARRGGLLVCRKKLFARYFFMPQRVMSLS